MRRARRPAVFLLLAALSSPLLLPALAAVAAEPASGAVSPDAPEITWEGAAFTTPNPTGVCLPEDPACDSFSLEVTPFPGRSDLLLTASATTEGDDIDMTVYGPDGTQVGASASAGGNEAVTLKDVAAGTYTVEVLNWVGTPGSSYTGAARLLEVGDPGARALEDDDVRWSYDLDAPQASATVPLRVVAVGFEPGELDEQALFAQIPDHQRVGVLTTYGGGFRSGDQADLLGLDTLVNHGRAYYTDPAAAPTLPIELRWEPELVYAPDAFTDGLFAHMAKVSHEGTYSNGNQADFIAHYNATRGTPARLATGGEAVAPGSPITFIDAEATEDWIAEHSEALLGFETGRTAREPGYTVYVLNTYDSEQARSHLPTDRYHNFYVERPDPDTGEFTGIDWARIWGGRYRFMMVDLGAAPNVYESETWGNRNRSALGSAQYDPPLWEYRAELPRPVSTVHLADGTEQAVTPGSSWDAEQLQFMLARTVNQAVNFRFFHAYLYEPRPGTGRFYLSDNVWHDAGAEIPWASDLSDLYDQRTALDGLSSLTPYFEFAGDVQFEYLAEGGEEFAADQAALDAAKQDGDDIAGAAHVAMHTVTAMDYIDANPDRFLRGGGCFTTVPTLQVVVPGHYAWALPIAAGIATNRDGVPWGFLNSVNDVFKWNGATQEDAIMAPFHQVPTAGGAFTYTTIHEASHYLGLAHPHDTVGAVRGEDGEPVYYDGFTWAFNSTASPTTYSHAEIVYSILDQESIARGHLSYYLQWTDEALYEAGEVLHAEGITTRSALTGELATLRATAVARSRAAERAYADFRFVDATFAAQEAWRAAAAYHDLALGNDRGTAELAKSTTTKDLLGDPQTCAAGGPVTPADDHAHAPGTAPHTHAEAGAGAVQEDLPTTGGGASPLALVLLLLGTVGLLHRRTVRIPA